MESELFEGTIQSQYRLVILMNVKWLSFHFTTRPFGIP